MLTSKKYGENAALFGVFCFGHVAASQFYLSSTRAFKFELFLVIYSKNNKTPQVVYFNSVRDLRE